MGVGKSELRYGIPFPGAAGDHPGRNRPVLAGGSKACEAGQDSTPPL